MEKGSTWNKRLELKRVALDLTQEQAAELIGVAVATYGRWERGTHIPMKVYKKATAEAFQTNEEDLFEGA